MINDIGSGVGHAVHVTIHAGEGTELSDIVLLCVMM